MKNLNKISAVSFLVIAIAFAPLVGLAKEGKHLNESYQDTSLTPSISGIKAPTVLKAGETGTWTVKASDPQNGSLSYAVDWGDNLTMSSLIKTLSLPVFVQTSTFTHAYAKPGTYTIRFTVSNDAGLQTTSSTTVHITGPQAPSAPVITNLRIKSAKPDTATVRWTTDVNSSSLLWYSTTSPVDTSTTPDISHTAKIINHKIALSGLTPSTTYYVVVGSTNQGGTTLSSEVSFTTPDISDDEAPVITSLTGQSTINAGDTETVTVNAYDTKNGTLSYSADWGDSDTSARIVMLNSEPPFVQTSTFSHVYNSEGTYTATFTVENDAGLKTSSSLEITVNPAPTTDTTPPVITNIGEVTTPDTATITWTTDEPSNSEVFYSTTTPVDENLATSVSDDVMVTSHSVSIHNLVADTTYHFIVESSDGSDNTTTSAENTFQTDH